MAGRTRSTDSPAKASGGEGSGSGAGPDPSAADQPADEQTPDETPDEQTPDEQATEDGKVEVRAGGFVTRVDPPPETPEPINHCSVCGALCTDDGCPRGHGKSSGGWQIPED